MVCVSYVIYSMLRRSYSIQEIQRWFAETLDATSKHTHTKINVEFLISTLMRGEAQFYADQLH